jgi:ribonuclease E
MASTEDQTDIQPNTDLGSSDVGDSEQALFPVAAAPARTRARKSTARRASSAPKAPPAEPAPPAEGGDAAPAETEPAEVTPVEAAPAEAAAPRPARKRAARKKATPAPAVVAEPADPESAEPETETETHAEVEVETAAEAQASGSPALLVPTFSLLFQAPVVPAAPPAPTRPAAEHSDGADEWSPDWADDVTGALDDGGEQQDGVEGPEGDSADAEADESGDGAAARRRRRRGGRGRRNRGEVGDAPDSGADQEADQEADQADQDATDGEPLPVDPGTGEARAELGSRRRTRRRRRGGSAGEVEEAPGVVTKVRERRDEVVGVRGSTRLEAKKQRRREGREAGRRRQVITEAEFLARRESVERVMVVRTKSGRTQIGVLEDGVLVEHYVSRETNTSMAGNIYLGRVQNVLPSMEAAFVDIGRGRNAVLYAGEVNWDAAGMQAGAPKRIENALESGQSVLVQVTKDPIGHKGARLTSQISLPGRFLVYVPESSMTGISRKLPDTERSRLKRILRDVVPETAGVIVRTAAEGASETELRADVERLTATWEQIKAKTESAGKKKGGAPLLLHGEPDLTVRVIRDVFNEDFAKLVVAGDSAWAQVSDYVTAVAPDLAGRLVRWTSEQDVFAQHRIDEQIAKAMDRKVWLPSGGSLVIDRTEAMTVVDVNTGKFIGSGGNLEETVTRNNIEAAEEIVRQLRLRDIGGIIVIDFIDMVLESNRDLVVRRLLECLGRDRTKHQVAEVTSLGLVQMTRKRVGSGLLEAFSEPCQQCTGRGYLVHAEPVDRVSASEDSTSGASSGSGGGASGTGVGGTGRRSRRGRSSGAAVTEVGSVAVAAPAPGGPTPAQIAAAAHAAALKSVAAAAQQPDGDDPAWPATESSHAADPDLDIDESTAASDAAGADVVETAPTETDFADPPQDEDPVDWPDGADPDLPAPTSAGRRRRRGRVVAPAGPPRAAGS